MKDELRVVGKDEWAAVDVVRPALDDIQSQAQSHRKKG